MSVVGRLRFLDDLPDRDLEALWQIAGCAAFPTLGEGFGLPVLEAMQRGVPVARSDIPAPREVGGDLPFHFDPRDELKRRSSDHTGAPGPLSDGGRSGARRDFHSAARRKGHV